MSVLGILGSSLFSSLGQAAPASGQQFRQEFQQLGQDLQSGNLSAAQSDFSRLQQVDPPAAPASSQSSSSPIAQAFKQLSQDLQAGNSTAAQQDYNAIQQAFQARAQVHHHHQQADGSGAGASAISQLVQQLGQALQGGNLSAAQQTYGALQQDFLQFAHNGGPQQSSLTPNTAGVSLSA
jgi:hypothetical protein